MLNKLFSTLTLRRPASFLYKSYDLDIRDFDRRTYTVSVVNGISMVRHPSKKAISPQIDDIDILEPSATPKLEN